MRADRVSLVGALRGPVMLITLGVLLAADHFTVHSFWRTWPALLIVFGLMKLLEKRSEPKLPTRTGSQGGDLS